MTHKIILAIVFALVLSSLPFAQVPRIMNYQGKLTDTSGVAILDTTGTSCAGRIIGFHIYDTSAGGTPLWGETLCVRIVNGLFDVVLGEVHPIELDFSKPYYMELVVDNDDDGSISTTADTLLPREKLAPVSFAFRSIYADTADYASGSLSKQDFRLGPEGTGSRIRGLVSSCNDLPSSGNLTWTEVTTHAGAPYNFCISSAIGGDTWYVAEAVCEDLGGRLCSRAEYRSFHDQTGASVNNYWVAGLVPIGSDYWRAAVCSNSGCTSTSTYRVEENHSYRCCVILEE